MVLTKEEKKKDILQYLDKNYKKKEWFALSKQELHMKFCDKEFSKDDIDNIIIELKDKDTRINKDTISFAIYYPNMYKKIVKTQLGGYLTRKLTPYVVIGFYILILVFSYTPIIYVWLQNKVGMKTAQDFLLVGSIIGVLGSYGIGFLIIKFIDYIESKIPWLQRNKEVINPISTLFLIMITLLILYKIITSNELGIAVIATVLVGSIVGGIAYANYRKKINPTQPP